MQAFKFKILGLIEGVERMADLCNTGVVYRLYSEDEAVKEFRDKRLFCHELMAAPGDQFVEIAFTRTRSSNLLATLRGLQNACIIKTMNKIPNSEIELSEKNEPAVKFTVNDLKAAKVSDVDKAASTLENMQLNQLLRLRQKYQEPELFAALTCNLARSK